MHEDNPMAAGIKYPGGITIIISYLVLVTLAFLPAISIKSRKWIPVVGQIESVEIERTRPGTPAWSLIATLTYQSNGQTYRKEHIDVFNHSDREVTEAELANWSAGKEFTVYHQENHPDRFSLQADGNGEIAIVLAIIFSIVAFLVLLPFYIASRRKSP